MIDVFKNSIFKVKKESLLSMLFILFETGFEIVVPFMMAKLIDLGIESSNIDNVVKFGFIIIALVIGQALSGILCAVFAVKAGTGFAYDLRERLFRKLQNGLRALKSGVTLYCLAGKVTEWSGSASPRVFGRKLFRTA